jgi:epoxide hydrolase-like predicted phosphatase
VTDASAGQEPASQPQLRGLVVDWGGVLTAGLDDAIRIWAETDGVDLAVYHDVIQEWLGPELARTAWLNPIHALERGELAVPDFEAHLAEELHRRTGKPVREEGLVRRMFDQFEHAPDMSGLVRRAHEAGLRTALLSNSWGNEYPRDGWHDMFDSVVISGEVGMRKPEPRIYLHTAEAIDLPPSACVFVDDLRSNVDAAVELGFVGVHHHSYEATALELEALFDLPLR